MSEAPDPKEAVADELTEQLDVGSLVTGDGVTEQVDGSSLGRAFGEAVGALAGRRLGRLAVDRVVSKLPFRSEDESEPSPLRRLGSAFGVALVRTLRRPQFREPIEDALRGYVEKREEALDEAEKTAQQAAEEAAGTVERAADEATDAAEETAEEAATEAEAAADEVTDSDVGDLTADDVQAIKEETYRELLETMEYSELQSIAKEVGVRANLKREEMLDAIVENFKAKSEENEDEDGE
ncbi:hypothetical protein [Haladaptatus salinisoli]|uniref:hypothetical protein n=1 Tax=Haladaptatus salinisoli TaxID=2884876 RepID=UPI001D09C012|nr:hypothetical protein [Haladaptatus salinisoli]